MQFTIVGAGALGTILGAALVRAGHPVRMLARGARATWLAEHGLVVTGLADIRVPCTVVTTTAPGADEEVLVFAVKTYHMDGALAATRDLRPRAVLSLANGVMKNEQLRGQFGPGPVLGCMANFSGELTADGAALFTRNVMLSLGGAGAPAIAEAIQAAGINCEVRAEIESVEWSKFVGWVALFALAVIARTTTGPCLAEPHFAELGAAIVREAAAVAVARGIPLRDQSPLPVLSLASLPTDAAVARLREVGRELARAAPNHRMSALQDLEAGRPLEVHETLGYAVREADRLGVPAPTLALCYRIGAGLNALAGHG